MATTAWLRKWKACASATRESAAGRGDARPLFAMRILRMIRVPPREST